MIQFRILGVLDLRTADGRTLDDAVTRSKRIALLAYLATARPLGFHRRDKLVTLFWPDLDKERARGALRTTLSRLRDDLGDIIESRGVEEIGVRRDQLWCDAVALRERVGQGDVLGAATLYGGAMLDGVHVTGTSDELEQWLSAERDAIRRTLLAAVSAEAEAHASRGALAEAADWARRARDLAPEDEVTARSLIRIMLSAGDRGAALLAYEMIESVLRRDFGVQPSDETRALVSSLRDEPPLANAVPAVVQRPHASVISHVAGPRGVTANGRWVATAAIIALVGGALVVRQLASANAAPVTVSPWRPLTGMQGQFRGRVGVAGFMDSAGGLVVVGGALAADPGQKLDVREEMWRLSSVRDESRAGFVLVPQRGERPGPRWLASMTYDDAHDRAIMHGGALGSTSPCTNDTWVLDNGSGQAGAPTWRRVVIHGATMPPTHAGVSGAFDPATRRLVIFGGNDCFASYSNEVWVLDFDDADLSAGHWTRIDASAVSGSPAPRNTAAVWLDASRNRLFVSGGTVGNTATSDLWVLDGLGKPGASAWRPLKCAGENPTRSIHAAVFDGNAALVFGGVDAGATYRRELFRLTRLDGDASACRWEQIPIVEPWPQARTRGLMIFDRRSHQLVLFGGEYQNISYSDVWTMEKPFGR